MELICSWYWWAYKSQLPCNLGCKDSGIHVFNQLPVMGKLLYLLRPIMVRPKRKKSILCMTANKPAKTESQPIDPRHTKLYYSIICDRLQRVFDKQHVHIGTSSLNTILTVYQDGSTISIFPEDTPYLEQWLLNDQSVSYLMTLDNCQFPIFNGICFPDSISGILTTHNAGGSSGISEFISMYYMYIKFNAYNFIPEMDIMYQRQSSMCDYIMEINSQIIAVSVTRIIGYPTNQTITNEYVQSLLYKKLHGIINAKRIVSHVNQFTTSVIHVWCQSLLDAMLVRQIYTYITDNDIYGIYDNIYVACSICANDYIFTNII